MAALEINAIVNGHRLFGSLSGEGETTVILDAGLGGTIDDWSKVQPEVAIFSKVFSYDRAGLGQSESPSNIPRTSAKTSPVTLEVYWQRQGSVRHTFWSHTHGAELMPAGSQINTLMKLPEWY